MVLTWPRGSGLVLVCALGSAIPSAHAEDSGARVQSSRGHAFAKDDTGWEQPLKAGDRLERGAVVRTLADGFANIIFADGSEFDLQPDSSVAISSHPRQGRAKHALVLFIGHLWSHIKKSTDGTVAYEVATPNAVAGVRGTDFETAVAADGTVRVRVSSGVVAVAGDKGVSVDVHAGQEVSADERGVGQVTPLAGKVDWKVWQQDKSKRLGSASVSRAVVKNLEARAAAKQNELKNLAAQRADLQAQRDALAKSPTADPAKAAALDKQIATLHDRVADAADRVASQLDMGKNLPEAARQQGAELPADSETLLKRLEARESEVKRLVNDGTTGAIITPGDKQDGSSAPAAPAPSGPGSSELMSKMASAEAELRAVEAQALAQGDLLLANCIKDLLSQQQTLAQGAQGVASQLDAAQGQHDPVAATQAAVRLSVLVRQAEALSREAPRCRGKAPQTATGPKSPGPSTGGGSNSSSGTSGSSDRPATAARPSGTARASGATRPGESASAAAQALVPTQGSAGTTVVEVQLDNRTEVATGAGAGTLPTTGTTGTTGATGSGSVSTGTTSDTVIITVRPPAASPFQ